MTLVVDTSALIAILLSEPEAHPFIDRLTAARDVAISASILHETRLVYAHKTGQTDVAAVDALIRLANATIAPFDQAQADLAFEAFRRFGAGRYGLNLSDCVSYALARSLDAPLLYKGEDFARTDVKSAA